MDHPDMPSNVHDALTAMRGPFTSASSYVSSPLEAQLLKIDQLREGVLAAISWNDPTATLEKAKLVMQKAVELCHCYPGDPPVPCPISTPDRPFTLMLNDFRLVNILAHVYLLVSYEQRSNLDIHLHF